LCAFGQSSGQTDPVKGHSDGNLLAQSSSFVTTNIVRNEYEKQNRGVHWLSAI